MLRLNRLHINQRAILILHLIRLLILNNRRRTRLHHAPPHVQLIRLARLALHHNAVEHLRLLPWVALIILHHSRIILDLIINN